MSTEKFVELVDQAAVNCGINAYNWGHVGRGESVRGSLVRRLMQRFVKNPKLRELAESTDPNAAGTADSAASSLVRYLNRAVRWELNSIWRRAKRDTARLVVTAPEALAATELADRVSTDPQDAVERAELLAYLQDRSVLSDEDRRLLMVAFVDELPLEQIGQTMNPPISKQAVHKRLVKIRTKVVTAFPQLSG